MIRAHLVGDVRAAEAALMATVADGVLMQRAATGLAVTGLRLLADRRGTVPGSRVVLLVGGGDNGGDTLYAGARLAGRGAHVQAVLLSPQRTHVAGLAALRRAGGRVLAGSAAVDVVRAADLVLDGIVGIGGSPGLRAQAHEIASAAAASAAIVVAVDLPSGVEVDTGRTPDDHVQADATVTFGTHKVCHLVDPAAAACGDVHLVDIGLGPHLSTPAVEALEDADVSDLLGRHLVPGRADEKYRRGVLGLHVGDRQYGGASVLAAAAAVSGGVGMLRVIGEPTVSAMVRETCPEAVLADGQVQAWLAGPGMDPATAGSVVGSLLSSGLPVVLDAGALGSGHKMRPDVLLTPHAGELARMLGVGRDHVESNRLDSVRRAAETFGATVLLKGSTTLVAAPDGHVRANRTGTPWLATAGSGDVLAGLAAAFLATGMKALDAGSAAAHVHGIAGMLAADEVGSPTARDVLGALPRALRRLRLPESTP